MISKCPGALPFSQPKPEIVKCPKCCGEVEIWTDEVKAVCPACKETVTRPQGQSCLDWCRYARECVGDRIYSKYMENKVITLKEKFLEELEEHFSPDRKRVEHAGEVMHFAEKLLRKGKGDWHIVIPASILHDLGMKEGPPLARKILLKIEFKKEDIDEICEIIAHHHSPGKIDSENFRLLYDADQLVNLKDTIKTKEKSSLEKVIDQTFLTGAGKELARRTYLS